MPITHPQTSLIARIAPVIAALLATSAPAQTGGVQGVVQAGASAASGVRVTLFTDSLGTFLETRTDQAGMYQFSGVAAGTYHLGAALPGRAYSQVDLTISSGLAQSSFALAPETEPGRWDIIGSTAGETFDASDIGVLLPDGRVMYCHDTLTPVIFNPVTGQSFVAAGSGLAQGCMNITLLADGRPIFVGGQPGDDPGQFRNAVRFVKAYDPAANSWQRFTDLVAPTGRWYPGMARLADGSLLAMGGGTCCQAVRTATCERLDLATMTWQSTGSMLNPSEFTPTALLHTGEVLITWSPPQLYNSASGQFRPTGPFVQPDRGYPDHSDHSLIVLADGRAAAIGIKPGSIFQNTAMAEIYSPATGAWSTAGAPAVRRFRPEVVQLPDGKVCVAAGDTDPPAAVPNVRGVVRSTDLFDPATASWRPVADMQQFREYHAVTLLIPDGRVITTGGTVIEFGNPPNSSDVEAFSPPYLSRGVRPQITSLSAVQLARGAVVSMGVFPATRLTSATLIGTGATTHWVDAGVQRRLVLPVSQTGPTATVTLPLDRNVLPAGHYILFAMVDDIPSIGRIVQVLPRCVADFNAAGGVTVQDIFDFLAAYFAAAPAADVNAVGGVTVQDVFDFLAAYFTGCP